MGAKHSNPGMRLPLPSLAPPGSAIWLMAHGTTMCGMAKPLPMCNIPFTL